jgi:formate hydrogenlyase transcriptional activator
MRLHAIQANVPADLVGGHEGPVEESPAGLVWQTQEPIIVPDLAEERRWPKVTEHMSEDGVNSFCIVPLTTAVRRLGAMGFLSLQKEAYGETDLEFLQQVGKQVAVAVDNVLHHQDLIRGRDQLRLLLEVSESIASHRNLEELFRDLAQRLPQIVPFDYINAVLHEPARDVMRLWLLVTATPSTISPGLELPIDESPGGLVWKTQRPLTVNDVTQEQRFPKLMAMLRENGVQSFCVVPLTTAQRRLGAMGFGSFGQRAYQDAEINFMQQVANQVAVAVDNVLHAASAQSAQQQLKYERDRLSLVLEINNAVVSHLELPKLLKAISGCLGRVIPHDLAWFCLYDPVAHQLQTHALDFPSHQDFAEAGDPIPLEGTPEGLAFTTQQPVLIRNLSLTEFPAEIIKRGAAAGLKSGCAVPLISHGRALGTLSVVSMQAEAFSDDDAKLFSWIGAQVALAAANSMAYQEISSLKDKLAKEKLYLEEEIQTEYNFEEIVGDSRALKLLLKEIQTVAATDSTVLVLGETGSGKELVARALHNRSGRRERTFVKLNCAAIPTGLLESELFGHEKGAFTGAIATKIGRFELADRGTIFLDEVGEIPLELQVKLLRVLQEQEFERLGSTRTIHVNVRVIAATNRDLGRMVEEQEFRSDLYYRLKVFPITVPPLRDRPEDVPLLVRHFAQKFAQRMKKRIETIPSEAMKALQTYHWPGNVRELENFIERAVILTQGQDLLVSLTELKRTPGHSTKSGTTTLEQAEREHILKTLRETNWTIGGPAGAATKLGMKRTTLQSKMQKLGIARPS